MAIADVDAVIDGLAAIDLHARHNTTSVYTAATIFPMLPEKLSTDITSLGSAADRQAIVVEMVVAADGSVQEPAIYRAWVRNQAKLAYNSVAAWLEGGPPPAAVAAVPGLDENLRLQDKAAQTLKGLRQLHGALTFETLQARARFEGDEVRDLEVEKPNRATQLIEDFMVAANGVTAEFLEGKTVPLPPPRGPHAQALGSDRRDRPAAWLQAAGRARLAGPQRVPQPAEGGRSAAIPRPVAGGHQAAGPGRICGRDAAGDPGGRWGISGWPWNIIRIPPRPIAAIRISLLSGC